MDRALVRSLVQQRLVALQASAGMGGGVDLDQVADADPGVDLGCPQALVAQQRLDEADVGAALQRQGRGGVAQVAGAGLSIPAAST